jgi:phosphotriesterase-related protein
MGIVTVLGIVHEDEVGHTQMHEHLICDLSGYISENDRQQSCAVDLGNYYATRVDRNNAHDMVLDSRTDAIEALRDYSIAGGSVLVDATPRGLGRDPEGLRKIALASGTHVVMGCGYYVGSFHPPTTALMSEDEVCEEIVGDLQVGVGPRRIRAGIIGEIGLSWPAQDDELKVLRAAARAQRLTGAALLIHPGRSAEAPAHHLSVVAAAGGDISRTIMCHVDRTLFSFEEMDSLAAAGCILEFDLFGTESSYYPPDPTVDLPNDGTRVNYIRRLIEAGYGHQILIAEDVCRKSQLKPYGGEGYDHILKRVVPLMRRRGITGEQIRQITQETPRKLLSRPVS